MPGFPPIARPGPTVAVPAGETWVLPRTVDRALAEKTAREAMNESVFRPADIARAEVAPFALAYLPLWRVHVEVEGFHLGVSRVSSGGIGGMLPTGGTRHAEQVVLVLGRRMVACDPTAKAELPSIDLVPRARCKLPDDVVILPDVARTDAEREACDRLRRQVQPTQALYSKFDAHVRSATLCYYPVWLLRYRYAGAASKDAAPEECHVAVSGRTGKIVSDHHPSALRSLADKVKRWFD